MKFSIIKGKGQYSKIIYDLVAQGKRIRGRTNYYINRDFVIGKGQCNLIVSGKKTTLTKIPNTHKQEIRDLKRDLEIFEDFIEITAIKLKRKRLLDITKSFNDDIDVFFGRIEGVSKKLHIPLLEFIERHIEKIEVNNINPKGFYKVVSKSTMARYKRVFNFLKSYQESNNIRLRYEDIDEEFYIKWVTYLKEYKRDDGVGFLPNTIGGYIIVIKKFMRLSENNGYHNNKEYRSFPVIKERRSRAWLNDKQLKELVDLETEADLTIYDTLNIGKTNQFLDYFLLMCFTGMRVDDMMRLRKDNIMVFNGVEMISFYEKKVKKERVFRITDDVRNILERWDNGFPNDTLRRKVNDTKINTYLQNNIVDYQNKEDGGKIENHSARRSFCTNELIKGTDAESIKRQSGHSTDSAFRTYIMDGGREALASLVIREERYSNERLVKAN